MRAVEWPVFACAAIACRRGEDPFRRGVVSRAGIERALRCQPYEGRRVEIRLPSSQIDDFSPRRSQRTGAVRHRDRGRFFEMRDVRRRRIRGRSGIGGRDQLSGRGHCGGETGDGSKDGARTAVPRYNSIAMEENSTPTVDAPIGPLTPGTAIGRTAHTFYLHPVDWHAAPELLLRLADRVEVADAETQVLILVPDADAAVAIAQAWNAARGNTYPRAMAATGASRTERVLRAGAAPVVLGTPREIMALVRIAALKLGGLRALALAWVDEILTTGAMADLEAVMADVPHDIVRTVIASAATPEVDAVLERYARPPVRVTTDVGGGGVGAGDSVRMDGGASYITVTPATRPDALRRLLDDLDPPSAAIYVRTEPAERAVAECLIALGYHGANAPIHVLRGGGAHRVPLAR